MKDPYETYKDNTPMMVLSLLATANLFIALCVGVPLLVAVLAGIIH